MIAPNKYMDLDSCVLRLSCAILVALRENGALRLAEVEGLAIQMAGERGRRNLAPTLSFLFLLRKIWFSAEADAIVMTKAKAKAAA